MKRQEKRWDTDVVKYSFMHTYRMLNIFISFVFIYLMNGQFGGQKYEEMQFTKRNCTALDTIECYGDRTFMKPNFPCVK